MTGKQTLQKLLVSLPFAGSNACLRREVQALKKRLEVYEKGWPPGHFYSPVPSLAELREKENELWSPPPKEVPGIAVNEESQLALLQELSLYYSRQPWKEEAQPGLRYFFNNPNFSYGEALVLFCLLMQTKPQRVIEVGCGYSSCALLDTRERMPSNGFALTLIEPYPDLLRSLLKPADAEAVHLLEKKVQDVPLRCFEELNAGDVLIIDSSHVSKIGSDVNHLLFRVLPALKSGVYVHFHDVYFPFEYPKAWVFEGRAWNEAYLLKAFLQYNAQFRIVFFNSYLHHFHREAWQARMPLCAVNPGSSLWLQKN